MPCRMLYSGHKMAPTTSQHSPSDFRMAHGRFHEMFATSSYGIVSFIMLIIQHPEKETKSNSTVAGSVAATQLLMENCVQIQSSNGLKGVDAATFSFVF